MQNIFDFIDGMTESVVDIQQELVSRPALSPDNNGTGEREKADWIIGHLKKIGITDIREYNAPDDRVPCGHRPNLVAMIPGKNTERTFWILAHVDVVPVGDLSLWDSDPWTVTRNGDTIVGRGVEDNHQGLVSALLAAEAILAEGVQPPMNFGMIFVADEETGSHYGLEYVVEHHFDLFGEDDLILVPDSGEPDSSMAEVAEKSILWFKITVDGKQCHASTPGEGINAMAAASALVVKLGDLYDAFDRHDALYDPPTSTFEATKREANVDNVNTIPGRDVFYLDCRILPEYDLDDVQATVRQYMQEVEKEYGCSISYELVNNEPAAPPTPVDAEIVSRIGKGVKTVYGRDIRPVGIGGGTVASYFREKGRPVLVWSTLNHFAHQPNEAASINNTLGDAKVMAHVLLEE